MRTVFLLVAMLAAGVVWGQTSPQITVSSEKVNVNGEVMYVHRVKGKETLYSISKAYNVPIDEIVRKNEQLKGGLKEGSTIYIPSKGAAQGAVSYVNAAVKEDKTAEAAPAATAPTVTEQAAPIAEKVADKKEEKLSGSEIKKYSKKKHTVKWYESIEDIAAKYGVSVDDIAGFNRLKSTVLTKKQVLYIPNADYIAYAASLKKDSEHQTEANENVQVAEPEKVVEETVVSEQPRVTELTYILPLNLRDSIAPITNFMDFYAGSLLAVNHLKESGATLKVNVIDQLQYKSVDDIVASGKLDGKRFIIGPVKSSDIERILELNEGKSLIISPMDPQAEKLIEGNSNHIQVPPANEAQQKNIVDLFVRKCTEDCNPVIIFEKGTADTTLVRMAKESLTEKGIAYTTFTYGLLEGREILDNMLAQMKPELRNMVFVPSNSEAFVSDVVRNLNLIYTNPLEENRRNITLFGLPKWRNFEGIEVAYFHRMNLHLSLPYYVDYSNYAVKDFLMKYRALFNNEPTPFAFQGYDITLAAFAFTGGEISDHVNFWKIWNRHPIGFRRLQINFLFERNGEGNGMSNTGTTDIAYNPDYTISLIK